MDAENSGHFWHFVETFSKQSTIHGVSFIGAPKLHAMERYFWFLVVAMAAGGSIALSLSNWNRYSANPTVVSIQKNFRDWDNVFPSVTACFIRRVNQKNAEKYIYEKWGLKLNDSKFDHYLEFVSTVANISYENLVNFKKFQNDTTLKDVNFVELIARVHPSISGTLVTADAKRNRKSSWTLYLSEIGVCFSVNAKFSKLLSYNAQNVSDDSLELEDDVLKCHYLNGLCYARYDSDPLAPLRFHVHSYLDVVHATSESPLEVHESQELEINYRMQETTSSATLKYLNPSQRKCRFEDEPLTKDMRVYSTSLCYMHCRFRLALRLCKCRPFFYHTFSVGKECNLDGLLCLAKYASNITKPPSEIGCTCPQPCNMITYLPQTPKITKWEYGYFDRRITFRWGLLPPTTKYERDVLFGFEDLVVSIGGILALFLGISFISAIEFLFLIFEYLILKSEFSRRIRLAFHRTARRSRP